jgi:hypothetical protein
MQEKDKSQQDPQLDTPAEANTEKHINFLEVEEKSVGRREKDNRDDFADDRKKQWEQGLKEGEEERNRSKRKSQN